MDVDHNQLHWHIRIRNAIGHADNRRYQICCRSANKRERKWPLKRDGQDDHFLKMSAWVDCPFKKKGMQWKNKKKELQWKRNEKKNLGNDKYAMIAIL